MSLNKFSHIPFVKDWCQIIKKKKVTNNHTKKSNHPKIFLKIQKFQNKSHPVKIKINHHTQALKNQKKKKKRQS